MIEFLTVMAAIIVGVFLYIAVPLGIITLLYWLICLFSGLVFFFPYAIVAYLILVALRYAYKFIFSPKE